VLTIRSAVSAVQPIDTREASGDTSDGRLVDGVARGESRAFDAIVLRYSGELLRYARRLGLGHQAAEDVLQQSLLKAWIALDGGAEIRALRPWLFRIVHNNAVNAITRQRETPNAMDADMHHHLSDHSAPHLDRVLDVRATLADVVALPQMQRDAILMSAVDGRSHDEVAEALGVSDGAVRGLLHRARRTLRAAAAAIVPPPLVSFFATGASRIAPLASRVAEGSAPGGGVEMGTELAKGAAVAAAAAVFVAGVAVVHPHAGAVPRRDARGVRTAPPAAAPASVTVASRVRAPIAAGPRLQRQATRHGATRTRERAGHTRAPASHGRRVVVTSPIQGAPVDAGAGTAPSLPRSPASAPSPPRGHGRGSVGAAPGGVAPSKPTSGHHQDLNEATSHVNGPRAPAETSAPGRPAERESASPPVVHRPQAPGRPGLPAPAPARR